ncbi:hypothetical protein GCM10027416_22180 [Okibacterium endophyticum]
MGGDRAKPAQSIRQGDEVRVRIEGFDRTLIVSRILVKRVGASVAAECYADVSPPKPSRLDAPAAVTRERGAGRPTKRERRDLERLRGR